MPPKKEEVLPPKDDEGNPQPSSSQEPGKDNSKYKLSRSVSLSRIDQADASPGDNSKINPKKRKEPPSPKSNVSVKEMKAKIDLQEKYRLQRNQKDVSKEKGKFKRTCK